MELFLILVDEVAMLLARNPVFDKGVAIYLHGWPKVIDAEDSGGHGSCAGMISAYAFMQFFYYVLACSAMTHLRSGRSYPRLYKSSLIIVYLAALASQLLLASGGGLPVRR